jgi:hypothetical protein
LTLVFNGSSHWHYIDLALRAKYNHRQRFKLKENKMNTIQSKIEFAVISLIAVALAAAQVSWVAEVLMA